MSLNPRFMYGALDLTDFPYSVRFGSDLSAPETIYELLSSMLADGDLMVSRRKGNRPSLVIPILIEEADLLANPLAAAALEIEADKPFNTLSIDPGDGIGPVTVLETFAGAVVYEYDEDCEEQGFRKYVLTMPARPFSRSEALTTIGSEFVSNTVTVADECESTSGWSVYGSGQTATITVDSTAGHFASGTGAVKLIVEPYYYDAPDYVTSGSASVSAKIRKTGLSIDASGGGYFVFRHRAEPGWALQDYTQFWLTSSGGGRQAASRVAAVAEGNGYVRYSLTIPNNSTITAFEMEGAQATATYQPWGSTPPNPGWWFDTLGIASAAGGNQAARTLEIGGSARGEGTLAVSASVGLGDALLYTAPDLGDGFRPDWRRFQTAGTSTTDTDAMNGSYVPANTGVFAAPASSLRPGAYVVLARVKGSSTSVSLDIAARTVLGGTPIGQTYNLTPGAVVLPDTTAYHVVRLGVLDLPPHRVDAAADAVVRLTLSGSATLRVDEILTFPLEDAALTWVECGTGSPSSTVASRLWIDGPSADMPYGQIVVGNNANRSDARFIQPRSRGKHLLVPGRMLAYLMTSTAGGAALSTSYFKRWHTWAGE